MAVIVEHPQFGVFEFQDGVTDQDIDAAFQTDIPNTLRAQRSGPIARRAQLEEDAKREEASKPFSAEDYFGGVSLAVKGQGVEDLKRQGYSLAEMATRPFSSTAGEFYGERAAEAGKRSQEFAELGEALDPSKIGLASRLVASTAVSSSPSIVGSMAGAGLAARGAAQAGAILGGSITGGAQSAADTFQRAKAAYQEQGDEEGTAAAKAYGPAAISGVMTGLITRAFGATGIEALGRGFKPTTIRGVLGEAAKQANLEGGEEALDQLSQGIYERALFNPRKTLDQIVNETLVAYGAGGVLGGGLAGAQGAGGLVELASEQRKEDARWQDAIERSAATVVDRRGATMPAVEQKQQPVTQTREETAGPASANWEATPVEVKVPEVVPPVAPTQPTVQPTVQESLTVQPAVPAAPAAVAPIAPTPTPTPASDPAGVSFNFHALLDYANLDATGKGFAFIRELPSDFPALQRVVLLGARESSAQAKAKSKTSPRNTRNFIALLDNDSGETHMVPVWAVSKKARGASRAFKRAMTMPPGVTEGTGTELKQVLATRSTAVQTEPRYTPVALAKVPESRTSFLEPGNRAFTAAEWQQIERDAQAHRELGRKQIQADARSREKYAPALLRKADNGTTALDEIGLGTDDEVVAPGAGETSVKAPPPNEAAAPVAGTPPPSGLTSAEIRQMFDLAQKAKTVGGFASLNGPFLTTLRGKLHWTSELLWQQLHEAIDSKPTSWEQFYELFDPDGYADFQIDVGRPAQTPRTPNAPAPPIGTTDPGTGAAPSSPADTLGSLDRTPGSVPGGGATGGRTAIRLVTPAEAIEVLTSPDSPIDPTVGMVMLAALQSRGVKKALDHLDLKIDLVESVNGMLSMAGGYQAATDAATATIVIALGTKDAETGAHELAHHLETLLAPGDRSQIAQARLQAINRELTRQDLPADIRSFLEAIATQQQSSKWFDEQFQNLGPRLAEYYSLINNSEFFATSFGELAVKRWGHSKEIKGVMARVRRFLEEIRDWFRRTFGTTTIQEQLFHRLITGKFDVNVRNGLLFDSKGIAGSLAHVWKNHGEFEGALNPGHQLKPEQIQQLTTLAATQQALIPQNWLATVYAMPVNSTTPEGIARAKLDPILDVAFMRQGSPAALATVPRGTPEEIKFSEEAAGAIAQQHGRIGSLGETLQIQADQKTGELAEESRKMADVQAAEAESSFLSGMMKAQTDGYRDYIANTLRTSGATATAPAAVEQTLNRMSIRVDEWEKSPDAIKNALRVISRFIPDQVLDAAQNPGDIVTWVRSNPGVFNGRVGADIMSWMTTAPIGDPPLAYTRVLDDLRLLRNIRMDAAGAAQEINDFKAWFGGFQSANPKAVTPLRFAQSYFQMRTQRDKAVKFASKVNRNIDRLDREIRGILLAIDKIKQLQASPEYQASVALAAEYGNVLTKGLMTQDPMTRQNVIIGPNGDPFTVDLRMEAASEDQNVRTLNALLDSIDTYLAKPPEETDPVQRRSYEQIRDHIRNFLLNPTYNPESGGWTKNFADIPGIGPIGIDMFGAINRGLFAGLAGDAQSVLTRIGGRAASDLLRDHQFLDSQVAGISSVQHDLGTGSDAVKQSALDAMKSHGLQGAHGYAKWKRSIENPLIASRQTVGGRWLNIGDVIPTSGYTVTQEDMDATKLEKKHQDGNVRVAGKVASGHPLKITNPLRINDTLGTKAVTRDAFGGGPLTMMRIPNMDWASEFVRAWEAATTQAQRMALLANSENLELAALGHVAQDSSEFTHSGPHRDAYNRVTNDIIKKRASPVANIDDLIDRIATELVTANKQPDQLTARTAARDQLINDITSDNKRFREAIMTEVEAQSLDGVPDSLVSMVSNQNSFTKPRKHLVAPSTYYDYSASSDQRMGQIRNSIRSIHYLRMLPKWNVLIDIIQRKVKEYNDQAAASSKRAVYRSSRQKFLDGETRMDYEEAQDFLQDATRVRDELSRLTKEDPDMIESGIVKAGGEAQSVIQSQLLSAASSVVTNTGFGPAFASGLMATRLGALGGRWSAGFEIAARSGRNTGKMAYGSAASAAKNGIELLTQIADRNPWMKSLLQTQLPIWTDVANTLASMSADYRRQAEVGMRAGTMAPPNIRQKLALRKQLSSTGGVLQEEPPSSSSAEAVDRALSLPGVRHLKEFVGQTFPGAGDRIANPSLTLTLTDDILAPYRTAAFLAWQAREQSGNPNWRKLDQPSDLLTPQELRVKNRAQSQAMRDLFTPAGMLDRIMLDYYERAKAVPVDQRHTVPFMTEGQEAAVTLEFLKATNLPADSNRAYLFKGRGATGLVRRFVFTFMGYIGHLSQQLSLLSTRHSKDVGATEARRQIMMMLGVLVLAVLVGSLGREVGQRLNRMTTGEASSRPLLNNVIATGDALSYGEYAATSMVSMIPYFGELVSRMFHGSANRPLFDPTASIPMAHFVNTGFNTLMRMWQTGDPYYPMIDFARQWSPGLRMSFNALGLAESDRAGRNALRALSAAAPSSIEQRRPGGSRGAGTQTPMTPIVRDLVAAAYAGNEEQVAAKYQQAVEEKRRQGTPDPEQAVLSQIQSQVPARRAFGRLPSEGELQLTIGRMSTPQRADYDRSVGAFDMISRVAGREIPMVQPVREERPTFSGATRTRRSSRGLGSFGRVGRRTRRSTFGRSTRRLSGFGRRRKNRRQMVRA